jgi:outer membrane protein TolC
MVDPQTKALRKLVVVLAAVVGLAAGTAPSPAAEALRIENEQILLTIEEAIEIALERNLSLAVERFRLSEAELTLWGSEGIFDPMLEATLSSFDETSPTASNLEVGIGQDVRETSGEGWDLSLGKLFATGGQGQITWDNSRTETNSLFATLNPRFSVDFDLSYTQPLMRDFGRLATGRQIRIARNNFDISRETFELQVTRTVRSVIDEYWNLVGARAQLEVARASLDLAKQLHEQNRIRVDVGTLAPLELVQSEAGVATREEQIVTAQALVGDIEDRLRELLNLDSGPLWMTEIVPETGVETAHVPIDVERGISTAMTERAELRSRRLGLKNLDIDAEYFDNQVKPRVDLSLRYGFNGQGGDATERDFITGEILREAPGDYGDAISQIVDTDFDGWSVAVDFAYPIGNRSAKSQLALAEVALERGEAELEELELAVTTEVRRSARAVRTAAQARESARVSRILEEKNFDAEQKRYENGMSTSFQVLQIQEDLSEARSREVAAVTSYRKVRALYEQAIGRLLEAHGVEIVEPEAE